MQNRASEAVLPPNQDAGGANIAPAQPGCTCGCGGIKAKHFKFLSYSFPIATAIREAAETSIELIKEPVPFIVAATICNFAAELGINSKFTVEGIEHTYKIIKKRSLPTDWPVLSKGKEIAALTTSAVMGTYAAFCDSILAYDFVYQLPGKYEFTQSVDMTGWKALSGITAGFVGMGRITGEGVATYQKARDLLAGVKPEYANAVSKFISPTAGFALGVLGSCSDAVMTCTGMYDVFNITAMPAKIAIGAMSSVNGVTDYCMNGTFVIECLDTFFGSFTPEEGQLPQYKNPKVIAALVLSLAAGSLLAYTYHGLAKDAFLQLLEELNLDFAATTTPVTEVFACGGATSYLVNATGSIYPIFHRVADKLGDGLNAIYNKVATCRQTSNIDIDDDFFNDDDVAIEFTSEDLAGSSDLDDNDPLAAQDVRNVQPSPQEDVIIAIDTSGDEEVSELLDPPAKKNSLLFNLFTQAANDRHFTVLPQTHHNTFGK